MSHPELPQGWAQAALEEIARLNPPNPDVSVADEAQVVFVPMAAVEEMSGRMDTSGSRSWHDVRKGYTRFQSGDVLFAKITPCMENGKVALVPEVPSFAGAGSTEFHVMRPGPAVGGRFLTLFLLQDEVRREARAHMTGTAGQLRVPSAFIAARRVVVPPLAEQRRIVEALDSHLTRLDAAAEGLGRVEITLKRYRASVLKAAVEGRLVPTEAELAKKEGRSYEPASVLLDRILTERRRRWEESELAKMKTKGETPRNNQWKEKYEDPRSPALSELPVLPEGWCWARAEQIAEFITKGTTPEASAMHSGEGDVPFVKVYNLTFDGSLDFSVGPTFVDREVHQGFLSRSKCRPGDVLMNIVGPPLGKVSILPGTHAEWNINQAIARYRPLSGVEASFLSIVLRSEFAARWSQDKAKATAGQFNLTLEIARDLPIPVPPAAEQLRIAEEEQHLLVLQLQLRREAQGEMRRIARLRQSILKWAFEGKLVDQDPADDPASVLLNRLRQERAAVTTEPKRPARAATRKTA